MIVVGFVLGLFVGGFVISCIWLWLLGGFRVVDSARPRVLTEAERIAERAWR